MSSSLLLSWVTFVYGLAACMYTAAWIFKKPGGARLGWWLTVIAVLGNAGGFVLRWVESYRLGIGHAPLSNMYESLVFFALTVGVIYLFVENRYQRPIVGVVATPMAFLAMAYASLSPNINDHIQPLVPALKSNWLIAHVITCFLGYAGFGVSAALSLMYLVTRQSKDPDTPRSFTLDNLIYQTVVVGFILLTAGIVTGSIWANSAWGTYWSWDPKETWSLITWLVYAAMLHSRFMRGWQGRRLAWFSLVGFACVLFTYFGVNMLLSGLHSYATGKS